VAPKGAPPGGRRHAPIITEYPDQFGYDSVMGGNVGR
jgi:hypothetical protein